MTKEQIIDETVAYYQIHKRGKDGSGYCIYKSGKDKCAVGRCMTEEALNEYGEFKGTIRNLIEESQACLLDDILRPEYRDHNLNFWIELQNLHDIDTYWKLSELGFEELNEKGLIALQKLKEKFAEPELISA
jgi:hypothetical protein